MTPRGQLTGVVRAYIQRAKKFRAPTNTVFPPRRLVWVEERAFRLSLQSDISATISFLVAVFHLCNYQHISVAIFHPRSCCLFFVAILIATVLGASIFRAFIPFLGLIWKIWKPGRSLNLDFYRDKKKEKLENPTEEVDLLLGCDKKIVLF